MGRTTAARRNQFTLFDETENTRECITNCASAFFVNVAAHSNRIGHVTPAGRARLFKFAEQKCFLSTMGKQQMNGLKMRAGHRKNVSCTIDQISGERLAAQTADINAV